MKRIGITTGDPAGIGPEITAKALQFLKLKKEYIYIVYGRVDKFDCGNKILKIESISHAVDSNKIYQIEIDDPEIRPGKPSSKSGEIALKILESSKIDLEAKELHAVVTCPISKDEIRKTDDTFIGHTEFYAGEAAKDDVIMSFWGPYFNLALLTTHLAVCDVSKKLDEASLIKKFTTIYKQACLQKDYPKIAMLAHNPHAGENGAFGSEDELVKLVLKNLEAEGVFIDGPFPADTFFSTKAPQYDLIISSYHDQGLIPFKMLSNEEGVNVTLGLPFIRTSVDHGTAFDIAGENRASEASLEKAIIFAEKQLDPGAVTSETTYSTFAKYYDKYMEHVDYDMWTELLLTTYTRRHKCNPAKTLELACGTGNIASRFVAKGLEIDASDFSAEMLKIAASKANPAHYFRADMLEPIVKESYDLILLVFDSINYLMDKDKISALLKNAYQGLTEKGMFIFDVSTLNNCEDYFDGFVNLEDKPNEYLIHQSEFDGDKNIQKSHLTFFLKQGFQFKRYDEIHQQRIYPTAELVELIKQSGFKLHAIHSTESRKNLILSKYHTLDNKFPRLFFILEK